MTDHEELRFHFDRRTALEKLLKLYRDEGSPSAAIVLMLEETLSRAEDAIAEGKLTLDELSANTLDMMTTMYVLVEMVDPFRPWDADRMR